MVAMYDPVPELIAAVKSGEYERQDKALDALRELGPKASAAVPTLIEALKDRAICIGAAAALREIGSAANSAVASLVAMWKDPQQDYNVRSGAVHAFTRIIGEKAILVLIDGLTESDPETRSAAIWELGFAFPNAKETLPVLIEAFVDDKC